MSENYPAGLLFALAEQDQRMCFVFDLVRNSFIYTNSAFNSFFQIADKDTTPERLLAMVHAEDLDYLKESFANLREGEVNNNIELRMLLPNQKEYSLRLTLFLASDAPASGEKHTVSGYVEDISADKSHSGKLNELSNKKNSILNILSHDLAGPLGSIQNLAALLSRKTRLFEDPEIGNQLYLIEKISKKGIHLIQEFIKQEFLESAAVPLVKRRENLVEKLEAVMQEYQQSENETGKIFRFHCPQQSVYVLIDESKFLQVINNLISNAIKFTPDGGTIALSLEEKEQQVLITLRDTGIGIPEKFHAGLFDKFNDARRPGLKGEPSVGLGMSIIKAIVEWHEGRIWFESEVNKGSTFFIEMQKCV